MDEQQADGTQSRSLATAEDQAAVEAVVEAEGGEDGAGTAAIVGEGEDPGDLGPASADTEAAGASAAAGAAAAHGSRGSRGSLGSRGGVTGAPEGTISGDAIRIVQGGAQSIQGGTVSVLQGGAQTIRAARVDVRQGGAGRVEGGEVSVRQGAIGFAKGERIQLELGAMGAAIGTHVELHQGVTRFVAARESVRMEQAGAMTVLANRVDMSPQSGAVFLFAREVHGDARSIFDWRAGAAFGAAFAVIFSLLRTVRGRVRG